MAYRDGNDLIAKNQVEAGLAKYQEAVKADPGNAQYRNAYLRARPRRPAPAGNGGTRPGRGRPLQAEQGFRRVLGIDAQNERAVAGLRAGARQPPEQAAGSGRAAPQQE
jgi:general secretion pathway protein D